MIRAQCLLKGCEVRSKRSVKTVAKSGSLLKPGTVPKFSSLCHLLLSTPTVENFRAIEALIRAEFQPVSGWLDWWVRLKIASKIFDAFKVMDPDLDKCLPDTTNPVGSLHIYPLSRDVSNPKSKIFRNSDAIWW